MHTIAVTVAIDKYSCHNDLIKDVTKGFAAESGDTVYLTIDLNTTKHIYGDYLSLLVMFVRYLRDKGVVVTGKFINFKPDSPSMQYASRIDFFKHMAIDLPENFIRHDSAGKFIEISFFKDSPELISLNGRITKIFYEHANIGINAVRWVDYCLSEIMDNAVTHSLSPISGCCQAQLFLGNGDIRLIIADVGIGVYDALTKNQEYSPLKPYQSISKCTEAEVTSRRAEGNQGNGLYHTTEFIKRNKGDLFLHSGAFAYKISKGISHVEPVSFWRGTYLYMRVNLDVAVSYDDILKNYDLEDAFNIHLEANGQLT